MADGYRDDCVIHAVRIARLLIEEGRAPWIGKLVRERDGGEWLPLIPLRFPTHTWTTHYVTCLDGRAYDPIAGVPIAIDHYPREVFGIEDDAIETHLDAETTARLIASGEIRRSFGRAVYREDQLQCPRSIPPDSRG